MVHLNDVSQSGFFIRKKGSMRKVRTSLQLVIQNYEGSQKQINSTYGHSQNVKPLCYYFHKLYRGEVQDFLIILYER